MYDIFRKQRQVVLCRSADDNESSRFVHNRRRVRLLACKTQPCSNRGSAQIAIQRFATSRPHADSVLTFGSSDQ
jgi:hypothetical protein